MSRWWSESTGEIALATEKNPEEAPKENGQETTTTERGARPTRGPAGIDDADSWDHL